MSALIIKIIACLTMLTDHIGVLYPPGWEVMRSVGRIAFPLYAYLIVSGYKFTRNKYKYLLRLVIFGVISEIPFDLFASGEWFDYESNNVMFTLALGLATILLCDLIAQKLKKLTAFPIQAVIATVFAIVAELLHTDYGAAGVLLIFSFRIFGDSKVITALVLVLFSSRYLIDGFIGNTVSDGIVSAWDEFTNAFVKFNYKVRGLFSVFALIPIFAYNRKSGCEQFGERTKIIIKYAFYAFYPVHMLILSLFR